MDDREKLVEMLEVSFEKQYEKRGLLTPQHTAEDLIANGVTTADKREAVGDKLSATGTAAREWISVKDRLPKPFETVFVYDSTRKQIADAYLTQHNEWVGVRICNEVTHWMPLPQPPKGE